MLTRRIAISACALSLAIPAAAGASSTTNPPKARGPYGITSATRLDTVKANGPYGTTSAALPDTVTAKGPYGTTPATLPDTVTAKGPYGTTPATLPDTVKAKGPSGVTTATGPQQTVKAKGPYGITTATGPRQDTTRATAHPAGVSRRDGTNGWRTAAISEAALLIAALALGSALLLPARRRAPRMGI